MPPIIPTRKLALAAGEDAAARHARKHGRTAWNEDDWNVGAEVFERLCPAEEQSELQAVHTPGPWIVCQERPWEILADDGDVFPIIATVETEGVSEAQYLADARLIAAAPKLLEALEAFEIETCHRCGGSGTEPNNEHDACYESGGCGETVHGGWAPDIKAALAKVKGDPS